MRKLIFFLFLFCYSAFSSQQHFSGSLKALTISPDDTLIANGNIIIDTSSISKATWLPEGQNYTITPTGTGRVMTWTGDGIALKDSTTGAATFADTNKITGNASVRISSSIGAIGFKTLWVWSGTTDTMVCLRTGSFWGHRILTGCSLLETSINNFTYRAEAGNAIRIDSGATYTNNNNINVRVGATGRSHLQHPNATWAGSGTLTIGSATGVNCNDTIGYLNRPTANVTLSMGGTGNYIIDGNIDVTGRTFSINTGGALTVNTKFINGANLTCAAFTVGCSNASATNIWQAGTGVYTITSFSSATLNTGVLMIDSLGSATFICAGSWTNGSNHTVVPQTSTLKTIATSIVTAAGEKFYNITDSVGNFTFADAQIINGDLNFKATGTLSITPGITMEGNSKTMSFGSGLGAVTSSIAPIVWNGDSGTYTDNKGITILSWTNGASGVCAFNGSTKTTITNGTTTVALGNGTNLVASFVLDGSNFTCQNSILKIYGTFTIGSQSFNAGTSKLYFYGATNTPVTANGNRFYDRVDSMDNGKKITLGDNQYHNTHIIKNGSFDFNGKIDTVLGNFSATNVMGDTVSAMISGSKLVLTKADSVTLLLLGSGRKRLDSLEIHTNKNLRIISDSNFAIKKIVTTNHGGTKYTLPCNKQITFFSPVDYDFSGTSIYDTLTSNEACSLAYVLLPNGNKTDSAIYVKNISVSGGSLICVNCIDGGGNSGIVFDVSGLTPILDSIRPYWVDQSIAAQTIGKIFKVYGNNYNSTKGSGTLKLGTTDLGDVQLWSSTLIIDTIPNNWTPKGTYNVIVTNSDNLSATSQIRVLIPIIIPMTP